MTGTMGGELYRRSQPHDRGVACSKLLPSFNTQLFNVKQHCADAIYHVKEFAEEIDPYAQPKRGIRRQTFVPSALLL